MGDFYQSGQNQQSTNNGQTTSNNTTNPLEPSYFSAFRQGLTQNLQSALSTASMPVYGQAQEASFLNNQNKNTNNSVNNLESVLASRGVSNSGANTQGVSNILSGAQANTANYQASVPGLNRAAFTQNVGGLLGLGSNFAGKAPLGSTSSSSGTTSSNGTVSQQSNPSPFSDLLGTIGAGVGLAGLGMPGGGFK